MLTISLQPKSLTYELTARATEALLFSTETHRMQLGQDMSKQEPPWSYGSALRRASAAHAEARASRSKAAADDAWADAKAALRKVGPKGWVLLGLFGLWGVGAVGMMLDRDRPESSPSATEQSVSQAVSPQPLIADIPAPPPASAEDVAAALAAEATTLAVSFLDAAKPCDEAVLAVGEKANDTYTVYAQATAAHEACAQSSADVKAMSAPAHSDSAMNARFESAIGKCGVAYAMRAEVYEALAQAMDRGDLRPSIARAYGDARGEAEMTTIACTAGIVDVITDAGGKPPSRRPSS